MTTSVHVKDDQLVAKLHEIVRLTGGDPESFDGSLITQMVQTCLRMSADTHDTGQLKLINSSLKEMWYAYRVFNEYTESRKISIFGSARTPEDHPDYIAAREFGLAMAQAGWMCITGAGDGIMKAGHEGPKRAASFGLSIRLPFETTANEVIENDPKLINFRYFFTRKLMFLTHAHAVAAFPGGYGTQDEIFETLVLIQTGKSNIVPLVLIEGGEGGYWEHWEKYVQKNLLDNKWISPEDLSLYFIASSPQEAAAHVLAFYRNYHSSRYVREKLVIRVQQKVSEEQLASLNEDFASLVREGSIEQSAALPDEVDHLDLPRIVFTHTRSHLGLVRRLIDRINEYGPQGDD